MPYGVRRPQRGRYEAPLASRPPCGEASAFIQCLPAAPEPPLARRLRAIVQVQIEETLTGVGPRAILCHGRLRAMCRAQLPRSGKSIITATKHYRIEST